MYVVSSSSTVGCSADGHRTQFGDEILLPGAIDANHPVGERFFIIYVLSPTENANPNAKFTTLHIVTANTGFLF